MYESAIFSGGNFFIIVISQTNLLTIYVFIASKPFNGGQINYHFIMKCHSDLISCRINTFFKELVTRDTYIYIFIIDICKVLALTTIENNG